MIDKKFEKISQHIADATIQVSKCFDFDIAAVTGTSGTISRRLLEAAGIFPDKIIHLPRSVNKNLYTGNPAEFDPRYRAKIQAMLEPYGIDINQDPRLLIVDEYINGGVKVRGYVEMITQLNLTDFRFAALVSSNPRVTNIVDYSKIFIPEYPSLEARGDAFFSMHKWVDWYLQSIHEHSMGRLPDEMASEKAENIEQVLSGLEKAIKQKVSA